VPTERAQKITVPSDPSEFKLAWGSISQDGRMIADCLDRISASRSKQEADLANFKRTFVQINKKIYLKQTSLEDCHGPTKANSNER
jgi:hypothetical protein